MGCNESKHAAVASGNTAKMTRRRKPVDRISKIYDGIKENNYVAPRAKMDGGAENLEENASAEVSIISEIVEKNVPEEVKKSAKIVKKNGPVEVKKIDEVGLQEGEVKESGGADLQKEAEVGVGGAAPSAATLKADELKKVLAEVEMEKSGGLDDVEVTEEAVVDVNVVEDVEAAEEKVAAEIDDLDGAGDVSLENEADVGVSGAPPSTAAKTVDIGRVEDDVLKEVVEEMEMEKGGELDGVEVTEEAVVDVNAGEEVEAADGKVAEIDDLDGAGDSVVLSSDENGGVKCDVVAQNDQAEEVATVAEENGGGLKADETAVVKVEDGIVAPDRVENPGASGNEEEANVEAKEVKIDQEAAEAVNPEANEVKAGHESCAKEACAEADAKQEASEEVSAKALDETGQEQVEEVSAEANEVKTSQEADDEVITEAEDVKACQELPEEASVEPVENKESREAGNEASAEGGSIETEEDAAGESRAETNED